jgi:hypothetical protein
MSKVTEETLEQTKFFTMYGLDIWAVVSLEKITQAILRNCETGENSVLRVGDDDNRFVPVKMPIIKAEPQSTQSSQSSQKEKRKYKKRINMNKHKFEKSVKSVESVSEKVKSKYKGVSPMGNKWRAQIYIKGKGVIHIGSYDTEELAHIAYSNYKEQLENNPDIEPDRKIGRPKKDSAAKLVAVPKWQCRICRKMFYTKEKPQICTDEDCDSILIDAL